MAGAWGTSPAPAGGWAPPATRPPARKRVHLIWLAVTVIAALVSGAIGFGIGRSADQISAALKRAGAAAGAGPCSGASAAPGSPSRLVSELLPVPAGATRLKNTFSNQVLTADQLVTEFYPQDPSQKAGLTGRCFEFAVQLGWRTPSGQVVGIYLLQFGTAADARSFILSTQSADMLVPENKVHFTVPGVSDGVVIQRPSLDKYGNTISRLLGDHGNVAVVIHLFVPARLPARSAVQALLRRQSAALS